MASKDLLFALTALAEKKQLPAPTLDQIDAVFSTKDILLQQALWRKRIEAKMWDGVSDVNSANEAYIRESNPWLDVVYVLIVDGDVIYMQTHDPFQEGHIPITLETVDDISDKHANAIAENCAQFEIYQEIASELNLL